MNPAPHPLAALDAYADHELPVEQREQVRAHLESCPECSAELDQIQRLKTRTHEAGAHIAVPDALESAIRKGVRGRQSSVARAWLIAAAAVAAVVFVVWKAATYESGNGRMIALLRIGVTDHVQCAVPRTYAEAPPGPAQMESDMGPQFKDLIGVMREQVPWDYRLEQAHRCTVEERKYVHLIFRNAPQLVSVTMTRKQAGESFETSKARPVSESWSGNLYQTKVGEYVAAGGETDEYLFFIVSNMTAQQNQDLAKRISAPLVDYLRSHQDRVAQALR
jgi:Putative zinc-finger